ncbi:MAG TPA: hypothetical protein PKD18_18435 [Saprospiraceae bacterium]|nr:hypothetical protein [Saprospiraceae bacterium]
MGPELLIPIVAIAGFWGAIITFIVYYYRSRHIERMALLENNKDASIFANTVEEIKKEKGNSTLKVGLLFVGLGLGLIVGVIIDSFFDSEPAGVFSSMLVFGGMSLIVYHLYDINSDNHKNRGGDIV